MNRETIMTTLDYYQDDHSAFYYWMAGYLAAGNTYPEEEDEDGWIKHDGGPCPVGDKAKVYLRFRDGSETQEAYPVHSLWWQRTGREYDIIAYRIVDE